jgi:enoyl-CoA hydratase/carnithine racemase
MPGADEILLIEKTPPVAWIKLNRPEAANALNVPLLKALAAACADLASDNRIHVVAIIGSGSKAFCAGADLTERKNMKPFEVVDYHSLIQKTFLAVENLPQPVIAALNGSAYGGGTELALACDLRVMVAQASIRLTEVLLGIIPGAGGTQRLPRLIGKSRAKEMIYFAAPVAAEQAKDWGLVHLVVHASAKDSEPFNQHLIEKVNEWIQEMLNAAPLSLRQAKAAIDSGYERDLIAGLALESEAYMQLLNTKDRVEALEAFAEKRKPVFKGE